MATVKHNFTVTIPHDPQAVLDGKISTNAWNADHTVALGADENFVTDTQLANIHAPGSDNQDLSGKEDVGVAAGVLAQHNIDFAHANIQSAQDHANLTAQNPHGVTFTMTGAAALYHNHQAGIERDEATNLFPAITDNAATSRVAPYTLEQYHQYRIVTSSATDFTTCGSLNNTAGTYFICTEANITLGAGDEVTEATVSITQGSAWMFDEADMDSMTLHVIDATGAIPLTFLPNEQNFVCARRSAQVGVNGTWVVLNSSTNPTTFDYLEYIPYFVANFRTGSTAAHNQSVTLQAHGQVEAIHEAKLDCGRYDIATGALRGIGAANSTLALTLGGGNVYAAYYKYVLPAVSGYVDAQNQGTRQFKCLWLGGNNWSYSTNTTPVLVNTHYNASGSMALMTDTYWACMYMWRGVEDDDHIYTYYSQAQYATEELAKASSMPTAVPPLAEGHGVFVGRIVFQKGQTSGFVGYSAFDTIFAAATPISIHNDLAGLNQGEFRHLTADEYSGFHKITYGTGAPTGGADGDIYIQYTV